MSNELVKQIAQTCADVANELAGQPEFFEFHRDDVPPSETKLPAPRYTGARSNDEELNLRVGAMVLLGMSDRAIERECGIDRRTIPHRLAFLQQTGRIPAEKERLTRVLGRNAEKSGLVLNGLLDRAAAGEVDSDLAAMIKAVATAYGIAIEKVQLLTGGPTEIVETRSAAPREEIEAFWKSAAIPVEATVSADDSASPANAGSCSENSEFGLAGNPLDTSQSGPAPAPAGDQAPATASVHHDAARSAQGRGGSPARGDTENINP